VSIGLVAGLGSAASGGGGGGGGAVTTDGTTILGDGDASPLTVGTIGVGQLGGTITAAGKNLLDDANAAAQRTTLGLHAIAASGNGADLVDGTVTTAELGGDITAAGKALLDDANAAAQRATLGLAPIAASGSGADLADGTVTTAKMGGDVTAAGKALLDDANAAAQRATLGLAAIAASGSGADLTDATVTLAKLGGTITAAGKAILDDADAAAQRATLGLAAIATSGSGADLVDATVATAKIADAAVTHAKQPNIATQRVVGRNTAGAGVREEVTAAQILDWVSNTNGVFARRGGAWVTAEKVGIDADGDLLIAENAAPTTPAAGFAKSFATNLAGRTMLAFMNAGGVLNALQPLIGAKTIAIYQAVPGVAAPTVLGMTATATGTQGNNGLATTNYYTSRARSSYTSAAGAGSVGGVRHSQGMVWRGNAAGLGGFHLIWRFGINDAVLVGTARMFVGLQGSAAAPTDVDPSTLANILGVGCDAGDTVLQLYAAGAAAQARVSLGANFPVNTVGVDVYELQLFCAPNSAQVDYRVTRLNTGHVATGTINVAANLPANTTLLTLNAYRSNGATGAATKLDVMGIYLESAN
jgi:hypothetical protein